MGKGKGKKNKIVTKSPPNIDKEGTASKKSDPPETKIYDKEVPNSRTESNISTFLFIISIVFVVCGVVINYYMEHNQLRFTPTIRLAYDTKPSEELNEILNEDPSNLDESIDYEDYDKGIHKHEEVDISIEHDLVNNDNEVTTGHEHMKKRRKNKEITPENTSEYISKNETTLFSEDLTIEEEEKLEKGLTLDTVDLRSDDLLSEISDEYLDPDLISNEDLTLEEELILEQQRKLEDESLEENDDIVTSEVNDDGKYKDGDNVSEIDPQAESKDEKIKNDTFENHENSEVVKDQLDDDYDSEEYKIDEITSDIDEPFETSDDEKSDEKLKKQSKSKNTATQFGDDISTDINDGREGKTHADDENVSESDPIDKVREEEIKTEAIEEKLDDDFAADDINDDGEYHKLDEKVFGIDENGNGDSQKLDINESLDEDEANGGMEIIDKDEFETKTHLFEDEISGKELDSAEEVFDKEPLESSEEIENDVEIDTKNLDEDQSNSSHEKPEADQILDDDIFNEDHSSSVETSSVDPHKDTTSGDRDMPINVEHGDIVSKTEEEDNLTATKSEKGTEEVENTNEETKSNIDILETTTDGGDVLINKDLPDSPGKSDIIQEIVDLSPATDSKYDVPDTRETQTQDNEKGSLSVDEDDNISLPPENDVTTEQSVIIDPVHTSLNDINLEADQLNIEENIGNTTSGLYNISSTEVKYDLQSPKEEPITKQCYHVEEIRLEVVTKKERFEVVSPGVEKVVLKPGYGKPPRAGDVITMHCVGFLDSNPPHKFWSTKELGQKMFTFSVGEKQVIKGWDEAASTMKLKESSRFKIQSKKAYGRFGFEAWGIPPNADLLFEFEVVDIKRMQKDKKKKRTKFPKS